MENFNKKIGWVIFGANSAMAKSLVELLSINPDYIVFCVVRDVSGKNNTENVFYFTLDSFRSEVKKFEDLDMYSVLFNGKVFFKKFADITDVDLQEMIDANFTSTVRYLQSILNGDQKIKKVLVLGSRAGQIVGHHKYFSLYAATKTACLGLLRSLSAEFPNTLFTYYICPSTDTDIFSKGVVDQGLLIEVKSKENTVKKTTEEIAKIIKETLENQTENFKDLVM